ncbi:MAG: ATP-binding protein [Coriobacteriaceae bacterium]|nr:ATP-binding protein [Coriobacteriaceae bacterium]
MIPRSLAEKVLEMATRFPVVSITGPRQSGKSTLVKSLFPAYRYVTLEDVDMRAFAQEDPRSFLAHYADRVILDEAQRAPELFSYLQGAVDAAGTPGQYIISGSQNFLLMEAISQSLAGRVAVMNLYPFSARELDEAKMLPARIDDLLLTGGYPRIYDARISPADYYPSYIQTYLERDVRAGAGILKLSEFDRFLALSADRTAQVLNREKLARDCGITTKTAESWLSVLEASFIAFRLQPYYRNFGKRVVKSPKLYLCDTGLASSLLGIEEPEDLMFSSHRGALFETAVVSEVVKAFAARGRRAKLYYWRDASNKEIDLVIEKGARPSALIEVKSSATYAPKFFNTLSELAELMDVPVGRRYVVYAGDESFDTKKGEVVALKDIARVVA